MVLMSQPFALRRRRRPPLRSPAGENPPKHPEADEAESGHLPAHVEHLDSDADNRRDQKSDPECGCEDAEDGHVQMLPRDDVKKDHENSGHETDEPSDNGGAADRLIVVPAQDCVRTADEAADCNRRGHEAN